MHHMRGIFHHLRHHMPGEMRHRGKHRHGRGFGHVFADMGEAGFDRAGFRTGRKLASDDLQLLLLALIEEKPSHGYDLIKLLEERSSGYYVPSPGMIYPALTYLEEAGHATIEQEGTKKLYRISEDGKARAGMGVDAADYDHSGAPSILITNFSNQMLSLYHNEGKGLFVDEAPRSEVGRATLVTLGFGCFFFDYDNDGWPDILVADGHIEDAIERVQQRVTYAEPPHVFRNLGSGKFQEVTASLGKDFVAPKVARGAAYADIDNDGFFPRFI